jgi:hypothetical protein
VSLTGRTGTLRTLEELPALGFSGEGDLSDIEHPRINFPTLDKRSYKKVSSIFAPSHAPRWRTCLAIQLQLIFPAFTFENTEKNPAGFLNPPSGLSLRHAVAPACLLDAGPVQSYIGELGTKVSRMEGRGMLRRTFYAEARLQGRPPAAVFATLTTSVNFVEAICPAEITITTGV